LEIYDKITFLMKKSEISAAQLARETGLAKSLFTQWKAGKQKPSAEKIVQISDYFGVPVSFLLGQKPFENWPEMERNWEHLKSSLLKQIKALFPEDFYEEVSQLDDVGMIVLASNLVDHFVFEPNSEGGTNIKTYFCNVFDAVPRGDAPLAPEENSLLDKFRKLNAEGQQKAADYVADLTKVLDYKK